MVNSADTNDKSQIAISRKRLRCYSQYTALSNEPIHDIWSKTISLKRRLVECDIWSIRRIADYDVWSTMIIGRKFVELCRNLVGK